MPKTIENLNDIVGKEFDLLTVDEFLEKEVRGRQNLYFYRCHCSCGTENVRVERRNLIRGYTKSCGCLHKKAGEDATEDLTGRQFERWHVLGKGTRRISPSGKTRRTMWLCECECGTQKEVGARALKTGMSTSCGCLQKERVSAALTDDLTGKSFGLLRVQYRNGSWRPKNGAKSGIRAVWHCVCECGGECDVTGELLKTGDVTSCGCKSVSKYELYVARYFDSLGYKEDIDYVKEKTFTGLVGLGGHSLRFDFFFQPEGREPVLIECQGEQHYKSVEWYGGQEYFEKLQIHDSMKREFAKTHGIKLVEIPYTKVSFESISQFLLDNGVL